MKSKRVLLVDDERLARKELRRLLQAHPEIEIVGEAGDTHEAESLLAGQVPDLIFLDIQMPGQTGLDWAWELPQEARPQIIFTTAYDQYAVRAFEVNALDYLLKPVEPERLARALERLDQSPGTETAVEDVAEPAFGEDDRVFIREDDRCWFVPVRQVELLESEGNYTRVFFGKDKALLYRSLNALEARLPERIFFRANRSHMINIHAVVGVEPWFSGSLKVTLTGGQVVELSRRQSQMFRERTAL